ncbi:MAG: histidine phosphatase family protein [Bacteroidetes bacterium]|nr:histidine phosphatase family protein [Bacteroidota bacterium]
MKTLILMRHAKSSWEEPGIGDIKRPLIPAGIRKTQLIINYFTDKKITPDLMISSPAKRAHETAKLIAKGTGYPLDKIRLDRKIYEEYTDKILDIIYDTDDHLTQLMIIGHNPTITRLANLFLHPGIEMLPTSGVVCISFDTDKWDDIPVSHSKEEFVVFPKMLK